MHPFFTEIEKYPELKKECRTELTKLPEPYIGKDKLSAILLGADPTNNGIPGDIGLKELDYVFGLNNENYQKWFFRPQMTNLKSIGLQKDNLYIQNICRNYFENQTSKNKNWSKIAKIWVKYLNEELKSLPHEIPVLITALKIMKVLVENIPPAEDIYNNPIKFLPLYSQTLQRNIYPLYRNPKYFLSKKYPDYKIFLTEKFVNPRS